MNWHGVWEWCCLECGDGGTKQTGFTELDARTWNSIRAAHSQRNPGCNGGDEALRARERPDSALRAGGDETCWSAPEEGAGE